MNSFIDTLNQWGGRFADFALPMLVQSSVLIVLLFALDLVLRNRVRAVVRYGLWMLVLIKLVLPPSFAAPSSLAYWLPEKKAVKTPPAPSQQFVVRYSDVKFDEARPLPSLPPPRAKLQFAAWLLLGWLAIAVGLMAWLVRRARSVAQTAARAFPASESPEQLLDACRQQMGIRQRVRLKLSATAGSPAVCGLWRPVVLIPQQLADKLSALQLRAVLLHELAHIQRGDVWVHYAQTLLQICYWWHPLFWLANAQIRRVREQAVDEAVVVAMGSEAEAYPATLVEVAKLAFQRPPLALGLIGIVESKSTLAQRIQRLLDRPVPKSAKLGLARLAAVALVGAVLLPMARGQRKQVAQVAAPTPQSLSPSAAIEVDVKFVSLTDAVFDNLLGFRPKTIAANGHFVWTLSPADQTELLQRMDRQPDIVTLSAPRVTTTTARQAQMAVDGIQPFLHPRAHTSAAFQIVPYQIGGSLDLAVSAKITETGDVGSMFEADLSGDPKEDTNDAKPPAKSNQVYAVNAVGYINYDVGTAQILVGDGGAVILHNPALTGANGRRILVVVSPKIIRQSASATEPNKNAVSVARSPGAPNPLHEAMDARRTPPSNSSKSQPPNTSTNSEGQRATKRLASSTGQDVEIEAIIQGAEIQYDFQPGICVVTNDFVLRFNGAVLTARRCRVDTKTGEVIAEGDVTLQRGDQVLRAERLLYNYLNQKITNVAPSNSVPVLGDLPLLGRLFRSEATPGSQGHKATQAELNPESGKDSGVDPDLVFKPADETAAAASRSEQTETKVYSVPDTNPSERVEQPASSDTARSNSVPLLGDLPFWGLLSRSKARPDSPEREAVRAKLNRIVLPEISFDNVRLPEALLWLAKEAKERDPDRTGLYFLLSTNMVAVPQAGIDPNIGQVLPPTSPQPLDMNSIRVRIIPPLKNLRLSDALEAIVKTADKPIRYSIEDYAVIFWQNPPGIEAGKSSMDRAESGKPQPNAPSVLETSPAERSGKPRPSDAAPSNSVPLLGDLPLLGRLLRSEARPDSPGREAIQAKLNRIVLPEIVFDNVPLPEALQWLLKEAGDRDPEGKGLAFLVNPYDMGPAPQTAVDPNTGEPVTLPPPDPRDMNDVIVRINPPLKNVRLADALEAIVKVAYKPIRYWVENEAVVFARKPTEASQLETRIFKVDPRTFMENLGRRFPDRATNDVPGLIKNFFTASGVNVLPPNTIYYKDRLGVLMVRATAEQLDRVQKAIEALNAPREEKPTAQSPPTSTRAAKPERAATGPSDSANSAILLETRTFRVDPKTFIDGLRNLQIPEADLPTAADGIEIDRNTTKPRTFTDSSLNVKPPVDDPSDRLGARLFFSPFSSPNRPPQTLLRAFFASAGVNVQPPNAVFFNDRTGVLLVRATSTELDLVQKAFEMLNDRPSQITIEAKFMELPTEAARQVGLDLPPPDRASDTWTRILTAAQTRAVLHAAEQHAGVDILSTPKITTLSGRQSQIQAVDIRTVVTGIEPKALAPPGVQSTNNNPAQPYLTSQVPCGPTLDVVPSVDGDGYTIHLAALPQVTEFLRYDTTLNGAKETRVWVDGKKQNVPMPLPVIRTRQMQASVDVYDGQTLVLGSPSVTMVSQQSNGQSVTNAIPEDAGKRLLVFITPTIIDPAGNPIHIPGREPFPADKPPPQQTR